MSLRNWFAKLPVPRIMIQHGKPGIGRYAVLNTASSMGKHYVADAANLPFVVIKKPE